MKTYTIAELVARAYVEEKGMMFTGNAFACPEGKADAACTDGEETVLLMVTAKRQRGEAKAPTYDARKLERVAVYFMAMNPTVNRMRFDVLEASIGKGAIVTVQAVEGAWRWDR